MTETILEKILFDAYLLFRLLHVPSINMEEVGFKTYTAASHQAASETLWLHFCRAVISSIVFSFFFVFLCFSASNPLHMCYINITF